MKLLILICSLSISPTDCNIHTADSYTYGPEVNNSIMCGLWGQSQIAQSTVAPKSDEYQLIRCSNVND